MDNSGMFQGRGNAATLSASVVLNFLLKIFLKKCDKRHDSIQVVFSHMCETADIRK